MYLPPPIYASSYINLATSVTWVAKYSSNSGTWYFGSGVSTNNKLSEDPMWQFGLKRGAAATGETYTASLILNGAYINYQSK